VPTNHNYLAFETSGTEACISLSGVAPPEASLPHPVIQQFLFALSIGMGGVFESGTQTRPTTYVLAVQYHGCTSMDCGMKSAR